MRHDLFDLFLLVSCAYALWFGGAPERLAGLTLGLGDILSVMLVSPRPLRFHHAEAGLLLVDVLILAILLAVALHSTRWWPLFLAGLQVDGVVVDLMYLAAPRTAPIAYLNATALWSYPMLAILIAGTWRHRRRLRRLGHDAAWKTTGAADDGRCPYTS